VINSEKTSKKHGITIILFLVVFLLGCKIVDSAYSLVDSRGERILNGVVDDAIAEQTRAAITPQVVVNEWLEPNSALEYAWEMGVRCIDAPGSDPCPVESCVPAGDQYTAVLEVTTQLFGKANPDDYSCGADYTFTNNSGSNLLVWHNIWGREGDVVTVNAIKLAKDDIYYEYHYNYYDRHDGKVTFQKIPKIYVLYDNPHCDWIQFGDSKLEKISVNLMNPCGE